MIEVPIPQVLRDAFALADRVLGFCRDHVFVLPRPREDPCWHDPCWLASQALLHVMHDALTAARLYAEQWPHRPYPIVVLVRSIYEATLQVFYLLRPDNAEERQARGKMFWAFQELENRAILEKCPGGLEGYEKQLSENDLLRHERGLEISEQAEAQFTPEQKRQLKRGRWNVTWTGRKIGELAREFEEETGLGAHAAWYGVMSQSAHVTPGMIHWSYTLPGGENEDDLHVGRCVKQTAEWLDRGSLRTWLCSLRLLDRYEIDLSNVSTPIDEEIKARLAKLDDPKDEARLRDDQTIRDLVERIEKTVHPRRIILFGSAARGDNRPNSDFDVLVVMPDGTDLNHAEDTMYRSMRGFGIPVDIIAVTEDQVRKYGDNPNLVIHTATTEGKEIYSAAG